LAETHLYVRLDTSLTIGTNVTSIGSSAFENCTGLTNITIPTASPASVTTRSIGALAWLLSRLARTSPASAHTHSMAAAA